MGYGWGSTMRSRGIGHVSTGFYSGSVVFTGQGEADE